MDSTKLSPGYVAMSNRLIAEKYDHDRLRSLPSTRKLTQIVLVFLFGGQPDGLVSSSDVRLHLVQAEHLSVSHACTCRLV